MKYYNEWYPVDLEEDAFKFTWDKSSNKLHFLVRMMNEKGASYEEVEFKKNGFWGLGAFSESVQ